MDTQQFIQSLIQKVLYAEKMQGKSKSPSYYPEYATECELAQKTRMHYDYNCPPDTLLLTKAPNQQEEEFKYAKENFKHITFPFWSKGENAVNRIWNRNNFSVKWNDQKIQYKESSAKEYFEGEIPEIGNIFDYFANVETKWDLRDPNAIIAVKPYKIPIKEVDGQQVADKSVIIEPIPVIYQCEQKRAYVEENYLLVERFDKTWIKDYDKNMPSGRIFEYYDTESIWIIKQIGKDNGNPIFDYQILYKHNLGYLPCDTLKGILETKQGLKFYLSYFSPAIPNLDEALIHNSTLQLSVYSQAYPHTWAYVGGCNGAGCVGGQVRSENGEMIPCPVCKGTGKDTSFSALKVTQIKMPDSFDKSPNVPTPPIGFVSPDIQILDFLRSMIKNYIIDAFAFLNIDVSNSFVKGSETALSKQIDREEFFSFLLLFSNQQFALLEFVIKAIGEMRYEGFKMPDIKRPNNFTIRTYKEITAELADARANNLPELAIEKLVNEYFITRFSINAEFLNIYKVIKQIDTLFIKTDVQIVTGVNNGTIKPEDVMLHNHIISFIYEELALDPNFLNQDIETIKAKLIEKAEGKICACKNEILIPENLPTTE